jgi:hypothetical protein
VLNVRAATRRQTPEATFAGDIARALLQSAPPGALLFTWGDNDTFPLWQVQAVEGVRPDVTIICLALAETPWYLEQLRRVPAAQGDRGTLAPAWRDTPSPADTFPVVGLSRPVVESLRPTYLDKDLPIPLPNGWRVTVPRGTSLLVKDLALLHILQQNAGRRPIAWSITASHKLFGLGPHLVQTGLALTLPVPPRDSARLAGGDASGPGGTPLDLDVTLRLIDETWHFGRLEREGIGRLDPNIKAMAGTVAIPLMQAAVGVLQRGDTARAIRLLQRARSLTDADLPARLLAELGRH